MLLDRTPSVRCSRQATPCRRLIARLRLCLALCLGLCLAPIASAAGTALAAEPRDVDAAIVIAVDISFSMDSEEQRLQRGGYIEAFNSPDVLKAVTSGEKRRIAVTYVEWAGASDQTVLVPWRIVEDASSARAFTNELAEKPYRRAARTSIAGALLFSAPLFRLLPAKATRRVIDVSGDGPNNDGIPVTEARERALAEGITINGLPIIWKRAYAGMMDIDHLDTYYETCVIGGDNSFMIPIRTVENIAAATRLKLIEEIADLGSTPRVRLGSTPRVRLVAASGGNDGTDCLIGEKLWRQRFGTFRN